MNILDNIKPISIKELVNFYITFPELACQIGYIVNDCKLSTRDELLFSNKTLVSTVIGQLEEIIKGSSEIRIQKSKTDLISEIKNSYEETKLNKTSLNNILLGKYIEKDFNTKQLFSIVCLEDAFNTSIIKEITEEYKTAVGIYYCLIKDIYNDELDPTISNFEFKHLNRNFTFKVEDCKDCINYLEENIIK
jgi:uncharacterized protein YutD